VVDLQVAAQLDLEGAVRRLGRDALLVEGDDRRGRRLGGRGFVGDLELALEDGQSAGQRGDRVGVGRRRRRAVAEAGLDALEPLDQCLERGRVDRGFRGGRGHCREQGDSEQAGGDASVGHGASPLK
jgi:hypothetical protein